MDNKGGYPHPAPESQPQGLYPHVPPQPAMGAPPAYEQVQGPPASVTVVQQLAVLGPKPARLACPSCQKEIVTKVKYEAGTKTHLFAVLICLLFWPCVCVPYFVDSCQNANHYCPHCDAYLGAHQG